MNKEINNANIDDNLKKVFFIFDKKIAQLESKIRALNALVRRQDAEIRVLSTKLRRY
jgi:hypothetical protein